MIVSPRGPQYDGFGSVAVGLLYITVQRMAPQSDHLHNLSNPLATVSQLSSSSSQLDGVPADLETSLRFAGAQLTQAAGILLCLPQEIIAQAIVLFYRFYLGSEGGSFRFNALKVCLVPFISRYLNIISDIHDRSQKFTGCFSSLALHDRQNLIPSAIYSISAECLYLSHFLRLSSSKTCSSVPKPRSRIILSV